MVGAESDYNIDMDQMDQSKSILFTHNSMGNGKIDYVEDIIYIDTKRFDKMRTEQMAQEIEELNILMRKENRWYVPAFALIAALVITLIAYLGIRLVITG